METSEFVTGIRSSLIYNMNARDERHEQHKCYTNDTSAIRVENFDFDNGTSKNIFSNRYIYYMASERLQGEEQFHSKNYHLKMPRFHAKMRLKSAPQKLNFLMTKAMSKSCTLDCSSKYPGALLHSYHSNTALLLIKTILSENTNILFSKNY